MKLQFLVLFLFGIVPPLSHSLADGAASETEITHLITYLASSGCEFNRNGSWYSASRAVSHLKRKYDYLRERNLASTAEAFIERAAAESSSSGKPYLVRCSDKREVRSADWFRAELARFRSAADAAKQNP